MNISHDDWIRTTDEAHEQVVCSFLQRVKDRGDIYKDTYEVCTSRGRYCELVAFCGRLRDFPNSRNSGGTAETAVVQPKQRWDSTAECISDEVKESEARRTGIKLRSSTSGASQLLAVLRGNPEIQNDGRFSGLSA